MRLQQIQNLTVATGSSSGAYKMADLTKKMSPDNPTQILTTHDLTSLRTLQRVINTNNNNTAVDDNVIYNSHGHTTNNNNNNNNTTRNHNYNLSHTSNSITNGIHNHHNNNNSNSNGNVNVNASGGNLVFSTIPLDGHALFIQPSHLLPANAAASLTSKGLQQATPSRGLVTAATNGLRTVNSINHSNISPAVSNAASFISCNSNSSNNNNNNNNNNSGSSSNNSLNSFLAKATILSANLSNGKAGGKIFSAGGTSFGSNTNMPTTSKYVLLQPNGNGQFTTYEGATPAAAAAAAANGNVAAPSVGNIVLLATEPLELNGSAAVGGDAATAVGRVIATTTSITGDNDEELRSLAWLNDSNLIKGIVTTSAAGGASGANVKRAGVANSGNICIVSASNAHELIEELPHHVVSEEVATTTPIGGNVCTTGAGISNNINNNNNNNNNNTTTPTELKASTQITALSVSDLQQLKRFGNIITTGTPITLLPQHDGNASACGRKDESAHIFGNISGISATTTVHMGPSGTTTVVEYKSNGNIPTLQPRQLLSAAGVGNVNSGTTITSTNLSTNSSSSNSNSNNGGNNNNSNNLNSSNYVPSSPSSTNSTHSIVASTSASAVASNPAALSVSYSTAPSTVLSVAAGANNGSTVLSLSKQLTTLPGGVVTVANGNGTTNTIYQGQQQQQKQQTIASNNNTSSSSSASSTTHHPHKKYLREKMNVLVDHGGGGSSSGGGGGGGGGVMANTNANNANTTNGAGNAAASTITVVASPASSSSSFSSSVSVSSSSSSTAAVNGGNSPVSKSFYAGAANNSHNNNAVNGNSSSGAINYSSTANTTSPVLLGSVSAVTTNGVHTIHTSTPGVPPTYAIMQYQSVASSPSLSSPEPNNSKEMYPLIAPQQQQQRNSMRSPISYSSYDNDSLKDFEISTNGSSGLGRNNTSTPQHQMNQSTQLQQQLSSSGSSASSKNSHIGSTGGGGGGGGGSNTNGAVIPQKQKHPNNVPYDPFVHTHNKPPYSFSSLIFMAIEGSNEKALPVKEIYAWIMQHFPYFKTAPAGWKNSVRHNLSLNKSFVKVEKAPNMGKGSLWRVEPQQRQNLIQALNRSPFFPNSAVDKSASLKSPCGTDSLVGYDTVDSVGSSGGGACSPAPKSNINPRIDPRLYPKLSKVIGGQDVPVEDTPSDYSTTNHNNNSHNHNNSNNNKYNNYNSSAVQQNGGSGGGTSILGPFSSYESIERLARDCGADSIDDVNAATAMLALKHGPKVFAETFQNGAPVITSSPSEDHTYSAGGGAGGGANSGSTTPVANGNTAPLASNGNTQYIVNGAQQQQQQQQQQNGCNGDNQSNYTSSDAAYESSEDNNNITPEELEDQRRQREGVDALLSLSRSSVVESPTKRPSSTSVEEEHLTACLETNTVNNNTNNNGHFTNDNGKMALLTSAVAYSQQQQHHLYEDSASFHSPSYYGTAQSGPHQLHHHLGLAGGSAQRKIKPLRSLRTKIKRKAPWMSKAR